MDKSSLLERIVRREKKLSQARRFRRRLLADDPRLEQLLPALNHARRFVMPRGKGSDQLVEGGLDSVSLDVDESTMSAGWVISAVNQDRYGDVVVPAGCKETLEDYRKNPQVFFAHNSNGMPVGLCEYEDKFYFDIGDNDIRSRCFFHGSTEESDKVFDLVAKHILRAASIGFLPVYGEVIPGGEPYEEGDTEIDFDMGGLCFHKWSIIEWSVVSVPANPDALRSWLCRTPLRSSTLKKSLEPFATPLKRNQIQSGYSLTAKVIVSPNKESKHMSESVVKNDMEEPLEDTTSGKEEGEDYGEESCQAVVLQPDVFPTEDDCVQWLSENGYTSEQLVPGDEAEDPWIAVQFEADLCELDTARREPASDGVELVYCVKKKDEDEKENENERGDSPDDRYTQDGDQVDVVGNPRPARSVGRNVKEKESKKAVKKAGKLVADEDETDDEQEALKTSTGNEADEGDEEEESGEAPYGAKVLRNTNERMEKLHGHLTKSIKVLEHEGVKKFLGKLQGHVEKHMDGIQETGAKHYPDHFKAEKTKAEEPAGEDEDMESGVDKSIAVGDFAVLKDAMDLLAELATNSTISKASALACRSCKDALAKVCSREKQVESLPKENNEQLLQTYQLAQEQVRQISDLVYALTGQEIEF